MHTLYPGEIFETAEGALDNAERLAFAFVEELYRGLCSRSGTCHSGA